MGKKLSVILLAAVMLAGSLFAMPAMAAVANTVTNSDMEKVTDNVPDGYEIAKTGTAMVEIVEGEAAHGGSGKALKITGTAETDTVTVSQPVTLTTGAIDVSAFMHLTSYTNGAGVKLELLSADGATKVGGTDYFTKTHYETVFEDAENTIPMAMGWRKMMLCLKQQNAGNFILRVTFGGTGSVVVDDIVVQKTSDYVRNGDLEGLAGDYKPAGDWTCSANNSVWNEASFAKVLKEADGNHYLSLGVTGAKANTNVIYTLYIRSFLNNYGTSGKHCVLQFDYQGSNFGTYAWINGGASAATGMNSDGNVIGATWGVWRRDYSMHFTGNTLSSTTGSMSFIFGQKTSGHIGTIDNLSLAVAQNEGITLTEKDGVVTATFTAYGTDYTAEENYRKGTVILARYKENEDGILTLDNTNVVSDTAKKVNVVGAQNSPYKLNPINVGDLPLCATATLEHPTDGEEYVYKAFGWDGFSMLRPQTASKMIP